MSAIHHIADKMLKRPLMAIARAVRGVVTAWTHPNEVYDKVNGFAGVA